MIYTKKLLVTDVKPTSMTINTTFCPSILHKTTSHYPIMKLSISSNTILLLGIVLLCIRLSNASPQNRRRDRHGFVLKNIRNNVKCPNHNSGVYKEVCDRLQKLYIRSPDKALSSYLRGGMQKAANRITHPVVSSSQVTFKIVNHCLKNFQQIINEYNDVAIQKYRECSKSCAKTAGERFENEIDRAGVGIANCIVQSVH